MFADLLDFKGLPAETTYMTRLMIFQSSPLVLYEGMRIQYVDILYERTVVYQITTGVSATAKAVAHLPANQL